jgi:hypothetical protein
LLSLLDVLVPDTSSPLTCVHTVEGFIRQTWNNIVFVWFLKSMALHPLTMSHLANISHRDAPNARRRRRHVEEPKGKMVMAPNYLALGAWYWNIEGTSGKWFSAIGGVISKLRFFSNCSIVLCSIHYIAWVLISILPTPAYIIIVGTCRKNWPL